MKSGNLKTLGNVVLFLSSFGLAFFTSPPILNNAETIIGLAISGLGVIFAGMVYNMSILSKISEILEKAK